MRIDGFWEGARRFAGGADLPAMAAAAGGWEALVAGGEGLLVELGVEPRRAAAWCAARPSATRGRVLTLADPDYPPALRRTRSPPPVLFVEGAVEALRGRGVAVVGTRACTGYGRGLARHLGHALAGAGLVVVSGLARGIDGEAHRGALAAGRTVAVVGHGLGTTAPPSHARLRAEIVAQGGAIVSTWPDAEAPQPWHFPERNAWIAGLSDAVIVVEAPSRSGALITARHALAEGREVLAVPGPVGAPCSVGCLELLAEGSGVVVDVARTVQALGGRPPSREDWLEGLFAGLGVDELARRTGRSVTELLAELARRELDGSVVRAAGGRYAPGRREA